MTSNPLQILPQTIFHAMGESTLQLAGTLLCKQLCWDGSCLFALFLCAWGEECKPKELIPSHLTEMIPRHPNQNRCRERRNTIIISNFSYSWWAPGELCWLCLEGQFKCRLCTSQSTNLGDVLSLSSLWLHEGHSNQRWRQQSQRMGSIKLAWQIPQLHKYFFCPGRAISITGIGSTITGSSSRSLENKCCLALLRLAYC